MCVFSERVTICEGGVDISDSDDEDESKFFLFSYEVVVSDIITLQWFTKKRDAGVLCKASLCSLRACMAFFFFKIYPETSITVTRRCSSSSDTCPRKSVSPVILLAAVFGL